eukprot:CAMPEP_0176488052 /NCGR_PEP_ID=MMETSP0200_2-20121128/6486_1 /TAXON_ID=947934 /ORGANISM="Chaetoceros sp., Strain GSL56" /LENGTH=665 /DNA_ID=CAMNT_0017884975 /DNA_START=1164 /DNA_END=3161 /DNA_ORIENTATION=-
MTLRGRLFRLSPQVFGKELSLNDFLDNYLAPKKMVILGEYHGAAPIVQLQTMIQEQMAKCLEQTYPLDQSVLSASDSYKERMYDRREQQQQQQLQPKVRVILEHFSMDMQGILNQYHSGIIDTNGLLKAYREIGTEGHNLIPYIPALESALHNHHIRLYGGFIPRTYARMLMKEGLEKTIQEASTSGFISKEEALNGTNEHYNYFESLLTGRNMHLDPLGTNATDRFREKMFPAQIIKDASMAWCVKNLDDILNVSGYDRMLLVCGVGHMLYSHGVPERILQHAKKNEMGIVKAKEDILRIACFPVTEGTLMNGDDDKNMTLEEITAILKDAYGGVEYDAADVCFLYEEDSLEEDDDDEQIRNETQTAYDKVGHTAHLLEAGNLNKAHVIMRSLHYTQEEIDHVGLDAVNYQGVGCPHRHVNIQEGDSVLDLGSGLGVDSLIATKAVGPTGRVVGIDISGECVHHANRRARERGVDGFLQFFQSPIERIHVNDEKIVDGTFDVIISNGAFCLLPNKMSGFEECLRLLKRDGKIALCTTVIKDRLEDGVEWPLCMRTFAKMNEILPMLEQAGFVDIEIDLSDSLMEVYEEEDETTDLDYADVKTSNTDEIIDTEDSPHYRSKESLGDENQSRFKVHNEEGQKQFQHLENFDMNQLCARIVIKARKP